MPHTVLCTYFTTNKYLLSKCMNPPCLAECSMERQIVKGYWMHSKTGCQVEFPNFGTTDILTYISFCCRALPGFCSMLSSFLINASTASYNLSCFPLGLTTINICRHCQCHWEAKSPLVDRHSPRVTNANLFSSFSLHQLPILSKLTYL
jgi:hypothetical protein